MTTAVDPRYLPNGLADVDNLPPEVTANDPRRHVYVILRVNRVYESGRAVMVETPDCYRGAADVPVAWMPAGTVPRHGGTYRFCIPAFRWNVKRKHLLALTRMRAADGIGGGDGPKAA